MLIDFNGADDFCRKSDIEELTEEIETLKKQKQPDAASKQDVEEVRPAHPAYSHFFGCMFRRSPFGLHTFLLPTSSEVTLVMGKTKASK